MGAIRGVRQGQGMGVTGETATFPRGQKRPLGEGNIGKMTPPSWIITATMRQEQQCPSETPWEKGIYLPNSEAQAHPDLDVSIPGSPQRPYYLFTALQLVATSSHD